MHIIRTLTMYQQIHFRNLICTWNSRTIVGGGVDEKSNIFKTKKSLRNYCSFKNVSFTAGKKYFSLWQNLFTSFPTSPGVLDIFAKKSFLN